MTDTLTLQFTDSELEIINDALRNYRDTREGTIPDLDCVDWLPAQIIEAKILAVQLDLRPEENV